MRGLSQRYFWVINLVLLAILAYLGAQVVNNILAGKIAALETHPQAKTAASGTKKRSQSKKSDWAETINNRNLFNANPPEEVEPSEEGGITVVTIDPGAIPPPWAICKKSESSISLEATMVAEPSEWSIAVVDDGEAATSRVMKENQPVGSDYVIAAIQRHRIVLSKGGVVECVEMGAKKVRKKKSRSTSSSSKRSSKSSKIKDGVKKNGKNSYLIDRGMLNEQLDDLATLGRQARVIPHYKDGRPQGFKIVGVRPGSLYSHIGVRSGDVIKSVNGEEITSPNKALELYERLKNSDNVNVDVERRGRPVALEYKIE